jgi:hypothetical protein
VTESNKTTIADLRGQIAASETRQLELGAERDELALPPSSSAIPRQPSG